jgi:hypothetical protein
MRAKGAIRRCLTGLWVVLLGELLLFSLMGALGPGWSVIAFISLILARLGLDRTLSEMLSRLRDTASSIGARGQESPDGLPEIE